MLAYYNRQGERIGMDEADSLMFDPVYTRVAKTEVTSTSDPRVTFTVSTVWLGLDRSYGDGPPVIFETMVFDAEESPDLHQRYSTEAQAREGHAEAVTHVAATVPDAKVTTTV